ncbi:MAG: hypothetical protein HQK54_16840 [Oligoflexales bacterium]|nr:hypothetical protein [Oligoflexales bacterium]
MDTEWIKNLARLNTPKESDRDRNRSILKEKLLLEWAGFMPRLYQEVCQACEVFNMHNVTQKEIKIIPLQAGGSHAAVGFILIYSGTQLKIEQKDYRAEVYLIKVSGFRRFQKRVHLIEPKIDSLGGIFWIMDKKSFMTYELLVKRLLVDLCHYAKELDTGKY